MATEKRDRWGRLLVPCKWCDMDTAMTGTKMCDRCYELDKRIALDFEVAETIVKHYHILFKGEGRRA